MTRRGFSLVELMVTVTIVGVLASLSLPRYQWMKMHAQSSEVIAQFDVVRQAALHFSVDSGHFPPEAPAGTIPAGLERYLPDNFGFDRGDWQLDFDNISAAAGDVGFVGVAAVTKHQRLADIVMRTLSRGIMQQDNRVTLIIAPED